MKIRVWDEENNKMIYDLSVGFGYAGLFQYIIGQSEKDLSIEVIKEGKNGGKLPVMESTNIFDTETGKDELYEKDIMEYYVLGERRIGVIEKRVSGEWAIQTDPGWYIGLLSVLIDNKGKKFGNIYENKELLNLR